jgi:predicted DNA-binding transcriptional regulator AlpA
VIRKGLTKGGTDMSVTMGERLWSVHDVADYLGIPVQTLYKWRQSGTGPIGCRLGKHLRYDPAVVRAWVRSLEEGR